MSDTSTTAGVEVTDNPGESRYEARLEGNLAGIAQYIRTDELIAFVHTEVERAYEGRGVGSALVRASLDAARADGVAVLAVCPFYTGWIGRHREYQDLLYTSGSRVTD
ncbi:GNAT family N-acetyltransferase [Actinomadura viridis]|uniref:GNAT family acetyltransferase n=1 Tax=Actinomadura viridis TaxID=58110 RepID=A0A931DKQ6_9ACTN|nr:GNAT family N-acetyltransferase [Actinomadura viridis]MBG6092999.1 putative GNAT family acetyltransferase [Actinomadura viridis]